MNVTWRMFRFILRTARQGFHNIFDSPAALPIAWFSPGSKPPPSNHWKIEEDKRRLRRFPQVRPIEDQRDFRAAGVAARLTAAQLRRLQIFRSRHGGDVVAGIDGHAAGIPARRGDLGGRAVRPRDWFPELLNLGRRGGPRPVSSQRRQCQIQTGEGIGSCIPEGPPIRRAFPWRAGAIADAPPPELRAKAPSRRA